LLCLGFGLPLIRLFRFAAGDELHSYIILMPVVCAYLAGLEGKNATRLTGPARGAAGFFLVTGLAICLWHWLAPRVTVADNLAQITLSLVLLLVAAGFYYFGAAGMRVLAFPFAMLVFVIPMPDALRHLVETGLQHGSAAVAGWLFSISDIPVLQDGVDIRLPGIPLHVAEECSGVHSTMVLFITSLVAGHFFLRSPWRRVALTLAVIPLALVRNGFRVFVLGELSVHVGPQVLDSWIHHHGGPIFFALSLPPFLLLLYLLRRSERPAKSGPEKS
jgi:exosortase C (VPDSG-CTERM-specific)